MKKHKKNRILIVEDELALADALSLKLGKAGFDVTHARDGEEGMDHLKKQSYDLVLLDIIMPKKDGFSVLTDMKAMKKKPPVFVLTNLGQEEDAKRALSLGAAAYFVKADSPLIDIVKKINQTFQ